MKKGLLANARNPICGAKETRTPYPLLAKQMRYQLRHSPIRKNDVHSIVGPGGLEPPTSSLSGMRSNPLSYGPNLYVENIQVVRLAHETKMSNSKSKRVAKLFYKITLNDCA